MSEYSKSGGNWVGKMLSESPGFPFPWNCLSVLDLSILHGHLIRSWNMTNVVVVWRDGRGVLVSNYYHCLFRNDRGNIMSS